MKLMEYDKVIASLLKKKRKLNLLLGNGFSVAYDSEIFSYNALYEFIKQIQDQNLSKIFDIVKTKNFELVMQQLDNFCELIKVFDPKSDLQKIIVEASENLKKSLLEAIKELHPDHVFEISDAECSKCAEFLTPYMENTGNIFSTNYDILLYWVLIRSGLENSDGFGKNRLDDPDDPKTEAEYSDELYWGKNKSSQCVFYLHGALPLFDTGIEIIKEQYDGSYLLKNIETRLNNGEYPIFVAAGDGDEKLNHIMHNQYLSYCYDSLSNIDGSLVTFGEYDRHIIQAINKAWEHRKDKEFSRKLWSVYIGVYSESDEKNIKNLMHLFKPKVILFDAKTANVWRQYVFGSGNIEDYTLYSFSNE